MDQFPDLDITVKFSGVMKFTGPFSLVVQKIVQNIRLHSLFDQHSSQTKSIFPLFFSLYFSIIVNTRQADYFQLRKVY